MQRGRWHCLLHAVLFYTAARLNDSPVSGRLQIDTLKRQLAAATCTPRSDSPPRPNPPAEPLAEHHRTLDQFADAWTRADELRSEAAQHGNWREQVSACSAVGLLLWVYSGWIAVVGHCCRLRLVLVDSV